MPTDFGLALALASAERTMPIVERWGSPIARSTARRLLDQMWHRLLDDGHENVPESAVQELIRLPESAIDDPYQPAYLAMRALGVIAEAADGVLGSDTWTEEGALIGARNLWGDLDAVERPTAARVVDPWEPDDPGPFLAAEIAAQSEDETALANAVDTRKGASSLREAAVERDSLVALDVAGVVWPP